MAAAEQNCHQTFLVPRIKMECSVRIIRVQVATVVSRCHGRTRSVLLGNLVILLLRLERRRNDGRRRRGDVLERGAFRRRRGHVLGRGVFRRRRGVVLGLGAFRRRRADGRGQLLLPLGTTCASSCSLPFSPPCPPSPPPSCSVPASPPCPPSPPPSSSLPCSPP